MKQCPRCRKIYDDDQLNFCLDDGESLNAIPETRYADDAPPTIVLDQSRVTNPAHWPVSPPAAPMSQWQPQNVTNRQFGTPPFTQSRDQTVPTIALILGILSIPLICCYGGIWLGVPAAAMGFIGMRNADSDSNRYGGRGMAVGGMVLGVISFLASLVFAFFAIIAS